MVLWYNPFSQIAAWKTILFRMAFQTLGTIISSRQYLNVSCDNNRFDKHDRTSKSHNVQNHTYYTYKKLYLKRAKNQEKTRNSGKISGELFYQAGNRIRNIEKTVKGINYRKYYYLSRKISTASNKHIYVDQRLLLLDLL